MTGGGVYDTQADACAAARRLLGDHAVDGRDFGTYPALTNRTVWIFEIPPRLTVCEKVISMSPGAVNWLTTAELRDHLAGELVFIPK